MTTVFCVAVSRRVAIESDSVVSAEVDGHLGGAARRAGRRLDLENGRLSVRQALVGFYLTSGVGLSDTHVVKSDVPSPAPPPPGSSPSLPAVSGARPLAEARSRTAQQLERDLENALRTGRSALPLIPGADGTPAIPSLIAVWLITQAGKAVGVQKPVKLSKVTNKQDLRSVGGVARLLHEAFHPATHGAVV